jgi:hypothetical protein
MIAQQRPWARRRRMPPSTTHDQSPTQESIPMEHITSTLMLVHPEQAAHWLVHNNFSRQRPLRPWHVKYLAQTMRAGRFLAGTQIHFAVHAGHEELVNGQHTLAAIVQSGCPQWLHVQRTHVPTAEEIAVLYGRHDRGLSRSLGDSYHAHGFAELSGLNKAQSNHLGSAMPLTMSGFSYAGGWYHDLGVFFRDQDLRWAMMVSWMEEAQAFFEDIAGTANFLFKALTRQAVLSVALVTYRHTGKDARDFWREVAKDNGLQSDHPAKTLIRFLLNTPANKYAAHLYAKYVASTWNAAYAGRTLARVHVHDFARPISLEGTPHTHNQVMRYLTSDGAVLTEPIPLEENPTVHKHPQMEEA